MADLDLSALEIFRQVAADGSVSKAAVRLNRVQSNVSTRIKQLEERLGAALFLRGRRGLTLTEDGHVLLRYAERLLALSDEAAAAVQKGKPSGLLRLGTMESTAASRLPPVLSRYHAQHPDVEIALTTDTAGGLIEKLRSNAIDAAFVAEPVTIGGVETLPVFTEDLVLIAPRAFPPLDDPAAVSGQTIIAFEQGCAYRRYLQEWLREAGIVPGGILSVGSYLAMLACVSAGTGFAVAPRSVLDMIDSKGEFRRHPLPGRYAGIRTLLVWRENNGSAKLEALKAVLPRAGGGY